jgi:hypothetical protein
MKLLAEKNALTIEEVKPTSTEPPSTLLLQTQEATTEPSVIEPQPPNSRCRELYSGSKFFWRTQQNIDIEIFLHYDVKCIEVTAYDPHANIQSRLYIDETILINNNIGHDMIIQAVEAKKATLDKDLIEKINDESIFDDEKRVLESSHILRKLQIKDSIIEYDYGATYNNPGSISPYLQEKPPSLIPVLIQRRKLSSKQEFIESMSELRQLNEKANEQYKETVKLLEITSEDCNQEKWAALHESVSSSFNDLIDGYNKTGGTSGCKI